MGRELWKNFRRHRPAVIGGITISLFVILAFGASVISYFTNINPLEQNVAYRYRPPFSRLAYGEGKVERAVRSYCLSNPSRSEEIVLALKNIPDSGLDFSLSTCDFLLELTEAIGEEEEFKQQVLRLSSPALTHFLEARNNFFTWHILGTDELGRDVLIRLLHGTRVSIGIGILVALTSAILGLLIGSLAGFYGGIIDSVCMRVTDSLLSLPLLPVMIVVAAIDLNKVPLLNIFGSQSADIVKVVFILCMFSWMTIARLVRGSILSLKQQDFISAAHALGAKDRAIILRHMLPNLLAPLLVAVTLNVGQSILSEAALSFLGLGIQPPTPSWGNMLFNAQEVMYEAPFLALMPGLLILIVVISFNFVGDGLQDAVDPKAIRR